MFSVVGSETLGSHEMQKTDFRELADELAQAFSYAELHCNLLGRYLQGKLPTNPKIPPFHEEEATLDALSEFVEPKKITELRAALSGVAVAFQHVAGGGFRSREECEHRIDAAKTQLASARRWLRELAESGAPQHMSAESRLGENAQHKATRKPRGASFVEKAHEPIFDAGQHLQSCEGRTK